MQITGRILPFFGVTSAHNTRILSLVHNNIIRVKIDSKTQLV